MLGNYIRHTNQSVDMQCLQLSDAAVKCKVCLETGDVQRQQQNTSTVWCLGHCMGV